MSLNTYERELFAVIEADERLTYSLSDLYKLLEDFGDSRQIQLGMRSLVSSKKIIRVRRALYALANIDIQHIIDHLQHEHTTVLGTWGLIKYNLVKDDEIVFASPKRYRPWKWNNYYARYAYLPDFQDSSMESIWLWSWNLGIGSPHTLLECYLDLDQIKILSILQDLNRPVWAARMGYLASSHHLDIGQYKQILGNGHGSIKLHPNLMCDQYDPLWHVWAPKAAIE